MWRFGLILLIIEKNSPCFTHLYFIKLQNIYFLIGFVAATMVNPVWMVKTRLQLHHGRMGAWECMKRIWQIEGLRGFYRVSVILLKIYEILKLKEILWI
jgi:hypothetical protein